MPTTDQETWTASTETARTTTGCGPEFRAYVEAVERCLDRRPALPVLIKELSALTKQLVKEPSWLPDQFREPCADNYARHLLHRDLHNRFVVLALVWQPGQGTPIHDHRCWGLMGMVQNQLEIVNYERLDDGSRPGHAELRETDGIDACAGATAYILPPYQEIHKIGNTTDQTSISIHIYGRDIDEVSVFDLEQRTVSTMRIKYYGDQCGEQNFAI
jgi:predicted metal-dependent enzyme (double-stranded beta helix superfamily)